MQQIMELEDDVNLKIDEEKEASFSDPELEHLNYRGLAREIARKMYPVPIIVKRYGLSNKQALLVFTSDAFRRELIAENASWNSVENAGERAKQRAREAAIFNVGDLAEITGNTSLPIPQRLEAMKLNAMIGGLIGGASKAEQQASGPIGPGFSVNIYLGEGKVERMTATPTTPTIEGDPS